MKGKTYICSGETYPVVNEDGDEYRLRIERDDDSESPREWDNVATMVCWHRRYNLGDKHNFSDPEEFLKSLLREYVSKNEIDEDALEDMSLNDCLKMLEDYTVIVPLYLYDHSGITISTGDFGDRWDSGQVGYAYISKQKIFDESLSLPYLDEDGNEVKIEHKHDNAPSTYNFKRIPADDENWRKIAHNYIDSEVNTYDQYLRGDVYGFVLEKHTVCECCGHEEWEQEDSCWGFYGDTLEDSGILEQCGCELKL